MSRQTGVVSRPSTFARVSLRTARVLLGLLGAFVLVGATYFSFFATVEEGRVETLGDWVIALWALVMAVALISTAFLLSTPTRGVMLLAVGLVISHILFSVIKLVAYDETEIVGLFAVDLLILAALAAYTRSRRED